MEIRDYKSGDEYFIKELFELVFKQSYSLDLWRWRFERNPAGKRKIKLMFEGDRLIGQYAVSPVKLNFDGVLMQTALSLATMTHPTFEGKGVFKNLARSLYASLSDEGYSGVWGYPNNNSHGGFIHSLGWKNLGVQHSLEISTSMLSKTIDNIDFQKFEFNSFDQSHVEFIQLFHNCDHNIRVEKDLAYLNWRYCDKPEVVYYRYFGSIEGFRFLIVCKLYLGHSSIKYLNILELYMEDFSILRKILSNILTHLNQEVSMINIWKSLFNQEHLKLERVGFKLSTPQTYVGIYPFSENVSSISNYSLWTLNMGDSDVF